MAPSRTLHIRCGTWEQVETFYSRKLRRGRLLSMRVPFAPEPGTELQIGLELPNHEVMTIDGAVRKCEAGEGDARHWIEIELVGLSEERLRGLRDLVMAATSGSVADSGISVIRGTDEVTPSAVTMSALAANAEPTVAGRPAAAVVASVAAPAGAAPVAAGGASASSSAVASPASAAAAAAMPAPSATRTRTPLAPPLGEGSASRPAQVTGPMAPGAVVSPSRPAGQVAPAGHVGPVVPAGAAASPGVPSSASPSAVGAAGRAAVGADEETASRALRHPGSSAPVVPALPDGELPDDERELFAALSSELRRLRQVAVHEVLGVSRDARAEEIRDGWMAHIRRFHPDVMARHRSDAVSHLAEELTILGNRAYDRLRVALVAEGRGAAFGPALFTPHGWLVGFDDLSTSDVPAARVLAARPLAPAMSQVGHGSAAAWTAGTRSGPSPLNPSAPSAPSISPGSPGDGGTGAAVFPAGAELGFEHVPSAASSRTGESFEAQARELLGAGDAGGAREVLATALVVYPRSRPLRSLYYVASALTALSSGQVVLATSQLETALAHHEGCVEASLVLDQIHRNGGTDQEAMRRLFQ